MALEQGAPLSWAALAERAAGPADIATGTLNANPSGALGCSVRRSRNSALRSERAVLLPSLDDALGRYLANAFDR